MKFNTSYRSILIALSIFMLTNVAFATPFQSTDSNPKRFNGVHAITPQAQSPVVVGELRNAQSQDLLTDQNPKRYNAALAQALAETHGIAVNEMRARMHIDSSQSKPPAFVPTDPNPKRIVR